MVQIAIKIPGKTGDCQEWTIVEFQGDLETRHPVPLSGKFIGDLHFTDKDAPVLIIGHHILHGKVITLEKPLAVIAKSSDDLDHTIVSNMEMTREQDSDVHSKKKTCYHVQAIIRTKILFKTRPKPIIAHVPKKL
uniref:Chromosome transmission fidelity protein 8 homolog n=1 Tax=Arion vulgaris TaxID=1028688 RepID=A0A0B6XZ03_9EUPU